MSNSYFHFKQFTIFQDRCAMKVGTDGVVLGALVDHENPRAILEIGVGTGVIALMLAQRFPESLLKGVEIDGLAFGQALENVNRSPWSNRISLVNKSFQEFYKNSNEKFEMILSNPPYYKDHIKPIDPQRNLALHNEGLPFGDLIKGIKTLLKPDGVFWLILPPRQMQDFTKIALFFNLYPNQTIELKDSPGKKILREITSFSFGEEKQKPQEFILKNMDGSHSASYLTALTQFLRDL